MKWFLVCLAAVAAAVAGVLVLARSSDDDRPPTTTAAAAERPLQIANGPVTASPKAAPLTLRLDRAGDPVHIRFGHQPRSGLLFDLDTGEVLWRRLPERQLPIASLTKMMTALVVVGREPADAKVRVTKEALAYKGSAGGGLPRGKRIKLETMLNGCCCRAATTRRSRSPSG